MPLTARPAGPVRPGQARLRQHCAAAATSRPASARPASCAAAGRFGVGPRAEGRLARIVIHGVAGTDRGFAACGTTLEMPALPTLRTMPDRRRAHLRPPREWDNTADPVDVATLSARSARRPPTASSPLDGGTSCRRCAERTSPLLSPVLREWVGDRGRCCGFRHSKRLLSPASGRGRSPLVARNLLTTPGTMCGERHGDGRPGGGVASAAMMDECVRILQETWFVGRGRTRSKFALPFYRDLVMSLAASPRPTRGDAGGGGSRSAGAGSFSIRSRRTASGSACRSATRTHSLRSTSRLAVGRHDGARRAGAARRRREPAEPRARPGDRVPHEGGPHRHVRDGRPLRRSCCCSRRRPNEEADAPGTCSGCSA